MYIVAASDGRICAVDLGTRTLAGGSKMNGDERKGYAEMTLRFEKICSKTHQVCRFAQETVRLRSWFFLHRCRSAQ